MSPARQCRDFLEDILRAAKKAEEFPQTSQSPTELNFVGVPGAWKLSYALLIYTGKAIPQSRLECPWIRSD
jgi:hypothetical protein